jgi:3-dehydroquinate synthase
MDVIQRQPIQVTFSYPVVFTTGLFSGANSTLRDIFDCSGQPLAQPPSRVLFVVDRGVVEAHADLLEAIDQYCVRHSEVLESTGRPLVIDGGESSKNDPRVLERVQAAIHDARLCRHSYVAAVGGGAVLDVVGYAAAIAHRGLRLIRIPTTVLSQDDSAVGVKNGVNAFGTKNYLGTFAPPFAVINDFAFLSTLSERDWRSGISEAIKVALVRDPDFFTSIEEDAARLSARDGVAMERLVRRSAALHFAHVATGGDPFELGTSRPLDFGHWAAHKLEQLTDHRLRHGEAVAIGIALDSSYALLRGFLPEHDWRRILNLLAAVGFDLWAPELSRNLDDPDSEGCVLRGLEEFREHLGGGLTIMLLQGIGQPFDVHEIDRDVMIRSIELVANAQTDSRSGGIARRAS